MEVILKRSGRALERALDVFQDVTFNEENEERIVREAIYYGNIRAEIVTNERDPIRNVSAASVCNKRWRRVIYVARRLRKFEFSEKFDAPRGAHDDNKRIVVFSTIAALKNNRTGEFYALLYVPGYL